MIAPKKRRGRAAKDTTTSAGFSLARNQNWIDHSWGCWTFFWGVPKNSQMQGAALSMFNLERTHVYGSQNTLWIPQNYIHWVREQFSCSCSTQAADRIVSMAVDGPSSGIICHLSNFAVGCAFLSKFALWQSNETMANPSLLLYFVPTMRVFHCQIGFPIDAWMVHPRSKNSLCYPWRNT